MAYQRSSIHSGRGRLHRSGSRPTCLRTTPYSVAFLQAWPILAITSSRLCRMRCWTQGVHLSAPGFSPARLTMLTSSDHPPRISGSSCHDEILKPGDTLAMDGSRETTTTSTGSSCASSWRHSAVPNIPVPPTTTTLRVALPSLKTADSTACCGRWMCDVLIVR